MRIISGIAGSVPLQVPRSLTRPTTDRVRESLFSALGQLTVGSRVLDLFAGTGSLGLEALSRGAEAADFVEAQAAACEVIRKNLAKTRLAGGQVHRRDVFSFLASVPPSRYDLVFADPPYAREAPEREILTGLLENEALVATLVPCGLLVLETLASEPLPPARLWSAKDERRYGTTRVSFLAPAC
jgi:16S rRNA (guanine966-N2)-methyltransferase